MLIRPLNKQTFPAKILFFGFFIASTGNVTSIMHRATSDQRERDRWRKGSWLLFNSGADKMDSLIAGTGQEQEPWKVEKNDSCQFDDTHFCQNVRRKISMRATDA